ncbi:hypothetical protein MMC30_006182 [Trapelia coarctata]|nr:hypothetical protein [Trapelia coarctata]
MSEPGAPASYPPVPSDVPIAELKRLSYSKLLKNDKVESKALFEACKNSGFFLLDLQDTPKGEQMLQVVEDMFGIKEEFSELQGEEKTKYALKEGSAYG